MMAASKRVEAPCPVCAEVIPAGALKCKGCGALRSWDACCESCGSPLPKAATVCHECGRFPRNDRSCSACRQPLPPDARSCGACGALQWFRGYFQISQSTLTLLLALVSSLTAFGAVMTTLEPSYSQTSAFFNSSSSQDADKGDVQAKQLWLEVENSGNRSARVQGARLVLIGDRQKQRAVLPLKLLQPKAEDPRSVPGRGRSLMVHLEIPSWDSQDFSIPSRIDPRFGPFLARPHRLELEVLEYGHQQVTRLRIQDIPKPILSALLCRSAEMHPALGDVGLLDPCKVYDYTVDGKGVRL
jgi:hypothetical protein